ncbi:ergosterol biosynthesis protein [Blastocladiella emersonii ATCC 22665]|nr:ergosterol biosynthesis protein [Blastocladiella emersonii ATCC 22665]
MSLVDSALAILPVENLGRWLAGISAIALASGINGVLNPVQYSRMLYQTGTTELAGRLFGIWNITSAVARLLCAYDLYNASMYRMTFASFVIAFSHFASEVFIFKTAKLTGKTLSPFIVSSVSMVWMWSEWSTYAGRGL